MTDLSDTICIVRQLDTEATKGPWHIGNAGTHVFDEARWTAHAETETKADASLIAYYRSAAPRLVDECERLRARVDVLENQIRSADSALAIVSHGCSPRGSCHICRARAALAKGGE